MPHESSEIAILGGSAAGVTAAITARRRHPDKRVVVLRKEDRAIIPCSIPYIFGTTGSVDKTWMPDDGIHRNGIDLIVDEVTEIDRPERTLTTRGGLTLAYERLVVATGSVPLVPPIPGFDKSNVYAIHKDGLRIEGMQSDLEGVEEIVVVGGGFIGVEMADELNKAGNRSVTIVETLEHCLMLAFDTEFCLEAERILEERGVRVLAGSAVRELAGGSAVEKVVLSGDQELTTDAVVFGIGAVPNVDLARKCGLPLGPTGAIRVDRTMRTEDVNVFACGDCAEKVSFFGGKPSPLRLASTAAAEARIAGANLYGIRRENPGTIGVYSTLIGDTAFACAGLTEALARRHGYATVSGTVEGPNRHPGCMPGGRAVKVKLVFEKTSRTLIGAQVQGDVAAGEIINIASACIQHKMTIDDVACFQMGTHPTMTASPVAYQLVNAAEAALLDR